MDTWEVWDIEKQDGDESRKHNEFCPFLSSHESTDVSKDVFCMSGERCSDDSETSAEFNVSKREISFSEEGGLFSPRSSCSNCSPTSRGTSRSGSRIRINSLSSYEDSIGLTSSYTLEEPGKEKRHILVMDGLRKCSSTDTPNIRPRSSSLTDYQNRNTNTSNIHGKYRSVSSLNNEHEKKHGNSGGHRKESSDNAFRDDSLNCEPQNNSNSCRVNSAERKYSGICVGARKNSNTSNTCTGEQLNNNCTNEHETNLTNSSSEDSSNNSFTRSYTLDEPGQETRHVYVVQKSKSVTTVDTYTHNSFDREEKSNINKGLSKSLNVVSNRYHNNNISSEQTNELAESPAAKKKNKSLFAKAKKFFRSPLKLSSTLSKLDKSESRSHSIYEEDGHGSTCGVDRKLSSSSDTAKSPTSSGESSPTKVRTKKTSDKESKSPLEKKFARFSYKKKKSESKSGSDTSSLNMVDKNDNEDEYDIINIVNHKIKSDSNIDILGDQNKDCCTPSLDYDISFKPENSLESNDQEELPSKPVTPLQRGLMSLVVGVGLGEEEETKNVVTNIVHPHSVEEHGHFRLGHCTERNIIPSTEDGSNQKITCPLEVAIGLLLRPPTKDTDPILIHDDTNTDDAQENSTQSTDKVWKSEGDYINDYVVARDFNFEQFITSTPIKDHIDHVTEKYPVTNAYAIGDYNESNTTEEGLLRTIHNSENKLKHIRHLKFGSNLSCDAYYSLLDEQYQSNIYTYSDVDSPCDSSPSPNVTSEGYADDYDVTGTESDRMSSMSDDSIASSDIHALVSHLATLVENDVKTRTDEMDQVEDFLTRKLSTDSLTSFEYHEREFINNSISPIYPLSPTATRSPKKVEVIDPPVIREDTIDYDEWFIGGTEEITERRMTVDLLNYMPAIEEDCESSCLEDEQEEDDLPQIHPPGDETFASYKNTLQGYCQKKHLPVVPQYKAEQEDDGFRGTVSFASSFVRCNEVSGSAKEADSRAAYDALTQLGYLKGVKFEMLNNQPTPLSPSECNQVRRKPLEKVLDTSGYSKEDEGGERQNVDPTYRDEQVNLEMGADASKIATKTKNKGSSRKNLKSKKKKEKQRVEDGEEVSQPSSPEKIWVYEPKEIDEYVNLDRNENVLQQVESGNVVDDAPEFDMVHIYTEDPDFPSRNAEQSKTIELSTDQSSVICTDNLNVEKDNLVFEIPIDNKQSLINGALSDVEPNNTSSYVTAVKAIYEDSPCVESYNVETMSQCLEDEDLIRSYDQVQNESWSEEHTDTPNTSFEDEGKREPIRRSISFGPSESSNDVDLDDLIDSIIEKNNEVIESMKVNDYSKSDKSIKKETQTKNTIPTDTDSDDGIKDKSEDDQFDMLPELIVTQASIESVESDSGVERTQFLSKMDVISLEEEEDEEEGDSGTELRYDDFLTNECSNTDYDYHKWVDKIKPLLYDAELVANLYIRLSNKYAKYITKNETETHLQHIHSAQIAYDVIKESNLTNFASVITHLLSYLGAIKSEKSVPENVSVPNLLSFLEEIIKRNTMSSSHVTMFTCFISRPNRKLTEHHELRQRFLQTCFKQEISQLNVNTEELLYLRTCFIKISEYFIQLDMKLANSLINEYLLPHITDQNSTPFIMDALTYMGLVKREEAVVTTSDITSALILLDIIFLSKQMSLLTSQKLYAFIQLNNPKFRFCTTEREAVTRTLKKTIDF